jgi:acetate---CoA ligase (ADP-forming)
MPDLAPLFDAHSIAVIGASDERYGAGPGSVLREIGFTGRYYPVNPNRSEVGGVRCYADVAQLPEPIDLAVIVIGRERVAGAVVACAEKGARAAVVISAGFAEADERGAELQRELSRVGRERGVAMVGPNCFGVASLVTRSAGFSGSGLGAARRGNVGVISNSGGLLNEVISYGTARGLGFSHLASTGNEAGVTAADVIAHYVDDPATEVVLAILETVRDPALFVAAAERARERRKPIVVLKVGASEKAARTALTHTGALAGSDEVYSALFRQKGITRVRDIDELIELGVLLSGARALLAKRRLERAAIIEISGGGTGLVADTAAAAGVELPDLSARASAELSGLLRAGVRAANPLDTGLNWPGAEMDRLYPRVLEILAAEPDIDIVVSRFTVPAAGPLGEIDRRLDQLATARDAHPERLFVVLSRTSDRSSDDWRTRIVERSVVFLQGYGRGLAALGGLARYSRHLRRRAESPGSAPPSELVVPVLPPADGVLSEVASKDLLRAAGLPVVATQLATGADAAARIARSYGGAVALKVVSPDIVHKSDVGGVRLALAGDAAVAGAFEALREVARSAGATFDGVAVQPMAPGGVELVMGAHRDAQWGPVVVFGLGGILVEVTRDVSLRVAPLDALDADDMTREIAGAAVLDGVRGQPPVDRAAIVDALRRLGALMLAAPRIASIDLNPVVATAKGIVAVDARVVLES